MADNQLPKPHDYTADTKSFDAFVDKAVHDHDPQVQISNDIWNYMQEQLSQKHAIQNQSIEFAAADGADVRYTKDSTGKIAGEVDFTDDNLQDRTINVTPQNEQETQRAIDAFEHSHKAWNYLVQTSYKDGVINAHQEDHDPSGQPEIHDVTLVKPGLRISKWTTSDGNSESLDYTRESSPHEFKNTDPYESITFKVGKGRAPEHFVTQIEKSEGTSREEYEPPQPSWWKQLGKY